MKVQAGLRQAIEKSGTVLCGLAAPLSQMERETIPH